MPCHTRMKTIFLQGVLWLCLLNFGLCVIEPGYLDFDNLPDTNFSCVGKVIGGYYADLETNCQMFHVCTIGQLDEPMDIRFLCLNGTVFDQETRVCERVDEVDCSKSEGFYHLNLELYGNTAPPIVEESGNTDSPISSSTTSTTTPRSTSTSRTTRATYFTTPVPTVPPPTHNTPKVITSNQFPISSGPDIRFNPEEINIRLTPGSPPIIKSPSVSFQQQSFNGDARITVTTHSSAYRKNDMQKTGTTTQKPKSVVSYGLQHTQNKPKYHSFDYYQNTENSDIDYHTDLPSGEYSDLGFDGHMNFESTNYKKTYSASTTKRTENKPFVISSTSYPTSSKPRSHNYHRTDKPPKVQLPLPVYPTLPSLTFSSPAPFSLTRHIETKRSNDQQRPRVVISASASVSDASGRRLNYSLGTIGQHILGKAPQSYDEYKEADVVLDPFYHDVPKVPNKPRHKRDLEDENNAKEVTSTEENETTTHWIPPDYIDDNYEPMTYNNTKKNSSVEETKKPSENTTKIEKEYEYYYEYVDDNYEPAIYDNIDNRTDLILTTTESSTEPTITQETTIESNMVTESMRDTTELPIHPENEDITTENMSTTSLPETTTQEQDFNTITSTETATVSTKQQENVITTLKATTEMYEPTTDTNEFTTSLETTTDNGPTMQNLDTTTEMLIYTTERLETTLNTETTMNSEESTTYVDLNLKETTTLNSYETTIETTTIPTTTTIRYPHFRPRNSSYKSYSRSKPTSRHRFSSPTINMSQSVLKLRGNKLTNPSTTFSSSEEIRSEVISHRLNKIVPKLSSTMSYDDLDLTEASLSKSANPTEPKYSRNPLPTTPLTKTTYFIPRRFTYDTRKGFNCFGRELNKFYEDPRDCRLFHYCTPGYSETQILDMKFVCDYGTYFDSDKLICTKIKPQRCK